MKLVLRNRSFTDYTSAMMKYDEEFVNKRYKEPEDGNFADATREILSIAVQSPTSSLARALPAKGARESGVRETTQQHAA